MKRVDAEQSSCALPFRPTVFSYTPFATAELPQSRHGMSWQHEETRPRATAAQLRVSHGPPASLHAWHETAGARSPRLSRPARPVQGTRSAGNTEQRKESSRCPCWCCNGVFSPEDALKAVRSAVCPSFASLGMPGVQGGAVPGAMATLSQFSRAHSGSERRQQQPSRNVLLKIALCLGGSTLWLAGGGSHP